MLAYEQRPDVTAVEPSGGQQRELVDNDWSILLSSIDAGTCTPFVGIEACTAIAGKRLEIARQWENKFNDPLFEIDVVFKTQLEDRSIDDQLRQVFADNKKALSPSAYVTVLARDAKWVVEDSNTTYVVEQVEDYLRVSEATYPFRTRDDLAMAAQYISVQSKDWSYPKLSVAKELRSICAPSYDDPDEAYRILSDLPFPVYITTNYNDFLYEILDEKPDASPRKVICRWNESLLKQAPRVRPKPNFSDVCPATPLVFHLYGHVDEPDSLVLTEDDYLEMVANIKSMKILPARVERAISSNTLLFLGYRSFDWDLRVLLRIVYKLKVRYPVRTHIAVLQIQPAANDAGPEEKERLKRYFDHYFESVFDIRVYWGTCQEFAIELRDRWQRYEQSKLHPKPAVRKAGDDDSLGTGRPDR